MSIYLEKQGDYFMMKFKKLMQVIRKNNNRKNWKILFGNGFTRSASEKFNKGFHYKYISEEIIKKKMDEGLRTILENKKVSNLELYMKYFRLTEEACDFLQKNDKYVSKILDCKKDNIIKISKSAKKTQKNLETL